MNAMSRVYESSNHQSGNAVSTLRRCMATVIVLASFSGLGQAAFAQAAPQQIYRGTATTNVELFDVYGQSRGVSTLQSSVEVVLTPRLDVGGLQETNPFRFIIGTIPVTGGPPAGSPGEISLWSSLNVDGVMFQYWQFAEVTNNSWRGSLTDSHVSEAIALNLLTVPKEIAPHLEMPMPEAMVNGTQMQMAVNGNQLTLILDGNSIGGTMPFHTEIVTQRVQ